MRVHECEMRERERERERPCTVRKATPSDEPASLVATHLYSPASSFYRVQPHQPKLSQQHTIHSLIHSTHRTLLHSLQSVACVRHLHSYSDNTRLKAISTKPVYQNVSILYSIGTKNDGGGEWWQLELYDMQISSQIVTTNNPTSSYLQAGCPSCRPTNSVRALKWIQLKYSALKTDVIVFRVVAPLCVAQLMKVECVNRTLCWAQTTLNCIRSCWNWMTTSTIRRSGYNRELEWQC